MVIISSMENALFSDLDVFMLRRPILSIEIYFEWINSKLSDADFLKTIFYRSDTKQFFESLKITSPTLYNTLSNFLSGKKIRDEEYFLNSIFKYFIRASTRCTPFCLFAGVSFGNFVNNKTDLVLNNTLFKKSVTADMEWLCGVIKNIENEFYYKLSYCKNEGVYIKGDRAILLDVEEENNSLIFKKSISLTKALKLILELTEEYIPFNKILLNLQRNYPNKSVQSLNEYLIALIKNRYLISELSPTLNNEDVLKSLNKNLKKLDLNNSILEDIYNLKQKYQNEFDFERAIIIYEELRSKMESIYKSSNYIQVDSRSSFNKIQLNSRMLTDLNNFINILLILNDKNISYDTKWQKYKTKFVEKYGESREVLLLELLDEDLGLGIPEGYQEETEENRKQWLGTIGQGLKEFFFNKFESAILKNEKIIEIKDSDFLDYKLQNPDMIPKSLDINLSFIKDELGNDLFIIGAGIGALRAGNSFGRFSNSMNNPQLLFEKINQKIISNDFLNCELRFLPTDVRNANISHCYSTSEFEIDISCKKSKSSIKKLPLDDIIIGIKDFKFYAKSISQNKIINFTVNNMFNRHKFPAILRFLWEVEIDQEIPWCLFYWDLFFYHYDYVPEIRYKNFVLSSRKWVISRKNLDLTARFSFEKFDKELKRFIFQYSVSRFVYIGQYDNRLVLDLQNYRCKRILYSSFIKEERISIWEYYEGCKHPVMYKNNSYCCDLFIPLVRNQNNYIKNNVAMYIPDSHEKRLKILFDEWISMKIYGANDRTDTFIARDISSLTYTLIKNKIIDKFFFLRYRDSSNHIRIRFHGDSETLLKNYSLIQFWMKNLLDRKITTNFIIDTYDRELERYGGENVIDSIETLFYSSSLSVIELLKIRKNLNISDYYLGLICTMYFSTQFELKLEEAINLFDISNSKFRDQFQKEREKFIEVADFFMHKNPISSQEFINIVKFLSIMEGSIQQVIKQLKNENLSRTKYLDIVSSIIHMHFNRLFSNNLQIEPVIRAITKYSIYAANKKRVYLNYERDE